MSGPWRAGDPCGLYLDVALESAVAEGDWIATNPGARYLVTKARRIPSRRHVQRARYSLRVVRLPYGADVPDDVTCWWMRWYSRNPVSRL